MNRATSVPPLPSRPIVIDRLNELAKGQLTREEAAAWADQWFLADLQPGVHLEVNDFAVWEALKSISAADLIATDRPFLYDETDFAEWAEVLRNAAN